MTKIMLIDDDESLQVLIGQIAERDGYEYCCAANGAEGLSMLRAERPDSLILDVMLPDTNGYDICETIRGEGRKIPIMFLSAKGDIVDKSIGFNQNFIFVCSIRRLLVFVFAFTSYLYNRYSK